MISNVIPLFGRNHPSRHEVTREQAHTHFLLSDLFVGTEYQWDPDADTGLTTLCGREGTGILDKDATPECEACRAVWRERTGWAFPLPAIVCT